MKERYLNGSTFEAFLQTEPKYEALWRGIYERARIPEAVVERARQLPGEWHLLVLSEDWCGDAVNSIPYLVRLTEQVPGMDLRILERDRNPDLMDAHLTNGARSIPVVIALDGEYRERGWWGPRPAELQKWVLGPGKELPVKERYREVRRWYARDRGATVLEEVMAMLAAAAGVGVPG